MECQLFANLGDIAGQRRVEIELNGDATVDDALKSLVDRYPDLEAELFAKDGSLTSHITVFLNGASLSAEALDRSLEEEDELVIIPPMTGG